MRARLILLVLLTFLIIPTFAGAGPPQEAAGFVDGLVGEALGILRDPALSDAAREERLDGLLRRGFDMPRIARYVLGRYWSQTNDEDRSAFATLFESWVVRTYSSRLSQYKGETVKVTGARDEGDGGAVVSSEIDHPAGPATKIEWRLERSDGQFKILDVTVAGVSMALTEREEIASAIQRNGGTVATLNRMYAEKLGGTTAAAAQR
jgi:phospholipid transport system substrate-binding protein